LTSFAHTTVAEAERLGLADDEARVVLAVTRSATRLMSIER
jgi:hypothetical protein